MKAGLSVQARREAVGAFAVGMAQRTVGAATVGVGLVRAGAAVTLSATARRAMFNIGTAPDLKE